MAESRRGWPIVVALAIAGCIPFHRCCSPVACPPPPARPVSPTNSLDGRGWGPVVGVPYTIVIDDRIAATIRSEGDSVRVERIWAKLDVGTIKAMEILRGSRAHDRYPGATGDVISITRCY